MENLGLAHDEYINYFVESEKDEFIKADNWYYEYDNRANDIITSVNKQIDPPKLLPVETKPGPKLKYRS